MVHFVLVFKSQKGAVGVLVMITMTLLLILGATLLVCNTSEGTQLTEHNGGVSAQYLADAGVFYAMEWLTVNNYPRQAQELTPTISTDGSSSITVSWQNGQYNLVSTGTVNGAKRKSVVTLPLEDVYDYVVYGGVQGGGDILNRGVSIYPSVSITGNVGSFYSVGTGDYAVDWITGFTTVNGNIEAGGTVDSYGLFGNTTVKGAIKERAKIGKTLPLVHFSAVNRIPLSNCGKRQGLSDYYHYELVEGQDYFYNGNLVLDSGFLYEDQIIGSGTLVVNGSVFIKPGAAVLGGPILIMATGDIYVGTGVGYNVALPTSIAPAKVERAVFISNNDIFINNMGNADASLSNTIISLITGRYPMRGSAIAKNKVTLYGASKITYDESMIKFFREKNKLPAVTFEKGIPIWDAYDLW